MSFSKISILLLIPAFFCQSLMASDTIYYEFWDISNLEQISGHDIAILGDPHVESTGLGNAVRFDGEGDQLMVDFIPVPISLMPG
jgi:hypothetical protein